MWDGCGKCLLSRLEFCYQGCASGGVLKPQLRSSRGWKGIASGGDTGKLKRVLLRLCSGAGRSVCRNAMIRAFRSASDATYRKLIRMY